MKIECKNCKKMIKNNEKKCPFCNEIHIKTKCKNCKKEISANEEVCPFCDKNTHFKSFRNINIFILIIAGIFIYTAIISPTDYSVYTADEIKNLSRENFTEMITSSTAELNIDKKYQKFSDCVGQKIYEVGTNTLFQNILNSCKEDIKTNKIFYNTFDILKDLNPYSGSYIPLEKLLKNEIITYKHLKTTFRTAYHAPRPYLLIRTTFTARNGFNALIKNKMIARIDAKTKEIFYIK